MNQFERAYLRTALWSSDDEAGVSLDRAYSDRDYHPETLAQMLADCQQFQDLAGELILCDLKMAGTDFWLTRNRHGSGFWDGDWQEDVGRKLTELAHSFGERHLYVGDDGKIHRGG